MAHPPAPQTDTTAPSPWGRWTGLQYGLLGLPLAFVALPLYVHLPHVYASRYGMSLVTLGLVLLAARLFDAVTDPWLGRFADRLQARSARRLLMACGLAALALLGGMALLFFPPWPRPDAPATLLAVLVLTCLAFSLLSIAHQAWGARLGGDERQRTGIVAWREGAGLVGVVLASVLPAWLGWGAWLGTFAAGLALGMLAWSSSLSSVAAIHASGHGYGRGNAGAQAPSPVRSASWRQDLTHPWGHPPFRRLMAVFVLNGMASAVPATLVLFFIRDRLAAPALEPLFLACYFLAAALSMPAWTRLVGRFGLARTWLTGMLLSVSVFAWAATLGHGDVLAYGVVCALSGLALGTDLALPGALLAGIIADRGDRGAREGSYFGWWNLAAKLNLALAAGLALPLLDALGYRPGTQATEGLQALTLAYAVLPCVLKLLAAAGLYLAFVQSAPPVPTHSTSSQEAP
jgi:glycoside/pentoside/hexuronide:cation symporter, GPH family